MLDPETSPIGTTDIVTRGFNLWTQAKLQHINPVGMSHLIILAA
jgi:hypothetical protein